MFTGALFTTAKTWKKPKCPPTDEQRRCSAYIYNRILLNHKNEENEAI